ncbi:hypothetical protein PN36_11135 [Candidatus Thiomargarita nelsonii]|uniref:Uncharacterized protein n=1 Tax=Candidatus Thiomargarita nelsonii TaxID=1003181 RepID=A0A0A6P7H8_9GAMM|nr:hypothetical protein PN36_11135 [Candidatus Thiomargarita nelsonii]
MKQNNTLLQRLKTYPGVFECHITVALPPNQPFVQFDQVCKKLGGKTIVIQLANGKTPTQPMMSKILSGDANTVLSQVNALTEGLSRYFSVLRLKIEVKAGISNTALPETTEEAELLPSSCYFEYHIKMQLEKGRVLENLRALFAPYHGYVSQNTLEQDSRWEYRFVTQRLRLSNKAAEEHLSELLAFLKTQNIKVKKVIREFNIFDSHSDLDAGWSYEN